MCTPLFPTFETSQYGQGGCRRGSLRVASSGDLDSFVAELNLDTKPAAKRLDVFP